MLNKLHQILSDSSLAESQFWAFGLMVLFSILFGIATEMYFLAGLPAFVLLLYVSIVDYRKVFFLLLFCIPLSTEIALPNGFGTDLPTEPIMVGLMLAYILFVLQQGTQMKSDFLLHPISLLILLHLGWIYTTTITSDLFFVSLKFSLAKTWYIIVFYFMAGSLIKTELDYRQVFWFIFIPLMLTVLVILVRHSGYGFTFADIHKVLHPFQRNHVNYAAVLSLFFPVVFLARGWYKPGTLPRLVLNISLLILFVAIYLTYTRAAYVALLLALIAYFILRMKLIRYALAVSLIGAILAVAYMAKNNTYLDYAPNYDRTITHKNFDSLIEATYKMEDISTMERVYRWIAGFQMSTTNPVFGFGPGNFVNFYKTYTVTSFQTYVSDNEEQSGIHSYYLMTLVEQGFIGLIIFLGLSFFILIKGETIYHQTTDLGFRRIVLMVLLCTIVIDAFLIINDLIETDKVGPFFFICIAVLVNIDLHNKSSAGHLDTQVNENQANQ